jgi:hypothetical protein
MEPHRTQGVDTPPNEDALLRFVTTNAVEVSEDWETGRIHPTMEPS